MSLSPGSTFPVTAVELPDQQTFRQYVRKLARSAIRVVMEEVMCEELDALIGVGWGQSSPKRKGYRNGTYTRDLVTASGRLEDIKVPRDPRDAQRVLPQQQSGLRAFFIASLFREREDV